MEAPPWISEWRERCYYLQRKIAMPNTNCSTVEQHPAAERRELTPYERQYVFTAREVEARLDAEYARLQEQIDREREHYRERERTR
jgi:hypothetical protein